MSKTSTATSPPRESEPVRNTETERQRQTDRQRDRDYMVERTNKAEIKPEEQIEKAASCRENIWNEMQLKGL